MKFFLSGFMMFVACLCASLAARADNPRYSTPEATLEALAVASSLTENGYDSFRYPVNVVAVSDILSSRRLLEGRPADPKFAFAESNALQNQFFHGSQTGNIDRYNFPEEYVKYPWQAASLRKASLVAVNDSAFIARVTNDEGRTAYLVLHDHSPGNWRVTAIAGSEEQALYYASDAFWSAYVAAKIAQLREYAEKYEALQALAVKLYSEIQLEETAFKTESRPDGDQILQFTLTIANDSDYVLEYADGSLRVKDEAGKYNFGASFDTKEAQNPVFAHSRIPYDVVIVFKRLKELGGPELVAHYRAGLLLLEKGEMPYEATLRLAKMVQGDDAIVISSSGAVPRPRLNPDERPDHEFTNETPPTPTDDSR